MIETQNYRHHLSDQHLAELRALISGKKQQTQNLSEKKVRKQKFYRWKKIRLTAKNLSHPSFSGPKN